MHSFVWWSVGSFISFSDVELKPSENASRLVTSNFHLNFNPENKPINPQIEVENG